MVTLYTVSKIRLHGISRSASFFLPPTSKLGKCKVLVFEKFGLWCIWTISSSFNILDWQLIFLLHGIYLQDIIQLYYTVISRVSIPYAGFIRRGTITMSELATSDGKCDTGIATSGWHVARKLVMLLGSLKTDGKSRDTARIMYACGRARVWSTSATLETSTK